MLYPVPQGVDESLLAAGARGVVVSGTVTGGLTAKSATTALRYKTTRGTPTLLASRPRATLIGTAYTSAQVLTIYGRSRLCRVPT